MRTTLKRGLGRGAAPNGNGRAVLPPGTASPMTLYRQPEGAKHSRRALVGWIAMWLGIAVLVVRGGCAGRRVPLLPPVGRGGRGEDAGSEARGTPARRAAARPAGRRADHRLRPPQGGRAERVGALGHAHARPGRPEHRLDLAALVPARHASRDPVPGADAVLRQDQRRLLLLPVAGLAEHGQVAHRHPDQLPHHGELPRLPSDRRPPRRRLDRRRSALLQQPRRAVRLREDQPLPRLPAAERSADARLRALPAHRLRPLPRGASAAVREGVQGPDPGELRADRAAEGRERDHEQRRGRAGRRGGRQRPHGPLVRALRLRAAEGPRVPDPDRGARGHVGAHDRLGEHHARRPGLRASRTWTRPRRRRPSRSARSCGGRRRLRARRRSPS